MKSCFQEVNNMSKINKELSCKDKYNIEFKKSGVSYELKCINNKKRIFISMKNLLNLL